MSRRLRIVESSPVGFGFRPTDEELVDHYLRSKILGMASHKAIIPQVDIYKMDLSLIPGYCVHLSDIQTYGSGCFFFSPLYERDTNCNQLQRKTNVGYWKSTGPDRDIKRGATEEVIGTKKTLVFHMGGGRRDHEDINTGWVIHEYRARMASLPANETIVLCRLKKKKGSDFPPQTNLHMLPELLSNQETGPMNMDVDDSSTGTGLHLSGSPNILTSGADWSHFANNIASDLRNQQDDMIPEEYAPPDTIFESLPVGYGFRPTDEELADHYLKPKILGTESHEDIIPVIEAYKMDPWFIPDACFLLSKIQTYGPEYFFFCPLHKKFPNRNRVRRTTTVGYWAKTGPDRKIKGEATEEVISTKKTFVFKMRRGPGHADVNTGWVIHEYSACMDSAPANTLVLCRLKTNNVWFSSMSPKQQSNQETWQMIMDVTGTGIHQNGIANNVTLGARPSHHSSSIASGIGNYQGKEMTFDEDPQKEGLLNEFTRTPPGSDWFPETEQGLDLDLPPPSGFNNSYGSMQFQDAGDIEFADSLIVDPDECHCEGLICQGSTVGT